MLTNADIAKIADATANKLAKKIRPVKEGWVFEKEFSERTGNTTSDQLYSWRKKNPGLWKKLNDGKFIYGLAAYMAAEKEAA